MAVVFPSKEWMEELYRAANSDEEYRKVAANWEGDFLCIVELDAAALSDFQNPKTLRGFLSMIDTVPKEKRMKYKGTPSGNFMEAIGLPIEKLAEYDVGELDKLLSDLGVSVDELAKKIAELKPEDFKGASLNVWLDFWHGELRKVEVAPPGEHEDARFKLIGPYATFKQLVQGKADAITLVVGGKLKLQGDLSYMMRNMAAVRKFTQIMGSIPIE
ncbi:MAG: SCP2 sterol-binding domain-containing protein [Archaeoglobaceae archaeon]